MLRTTAKVLAMIAIAATALVGCGKEDVTDLNDTWTQKESDLTNKINEIKSEHAELNGKFQTAVAALDPNDTTIAASRTAAEQTLTQHETKIAEIEATIQKYQAERTKATEAGVRADFETAWKAAEVEYAAAMSALDEIQNQQNQMQSTLNDWSKPKAADTTAGAAPVDTANAKKDTTTTM